MQLRESRGLRGLWELGKRGAVLVGLLFLTQGCGAKYHLNRAIAKDPKILDSVAVKLDTTIVTENKALRDTIILQRVDTITLERNSVRVKVRRIHDTIQLDAECLSDTITISKVVKVPQVIYQEKKIDSKSLWLLILSFVLYTFGLVKVLR
jgi:hypothetical protein